MPSDGDCADVSQALRVAWYRFWATLHDRWGSYVTIIVLVALLGGLAMAAIAGARRTQSSFPTLLSQTDSSNVELLTGVYNPAIGQKTGYNAGLIRQISHLPFVKHVGNVVDLNLLPLSPKGQPLLAADGLSMTGSVRGELFVQDRVIVTNGRLANPRRVNEFVMDSADARALGFHLGQVVTFYAYSNEKTGLIESYGPQKFFTKVKPDYRFNVKLVGLGVVQASNLMQDQVDVAGGGIVLFTPALTDRLLRCCVNTSLTALQLQGGSRHGAAVAKELANIIPKSLPLALTLGSNVEAKAEQTIKPESLALGAFGLIAGLAVLIIAGQVIFRRLRFNAIDGAVLRALGAGPGTTIIDGTLGIFGAVFAGSILAVLVAAGLSPLALLGPIRRYIPHGVNFDWTVLGIGVALIVVCLSAVTVVAALRMAPQRTSTFEKITSARGSHAARIAASANLPVPAVTGIRFALEPGTGRNRVPVRSAILGALFAVIIVVSTITFGASLHALVSKPSLYGWNWTYEMNGGGGLGDIPGAPAAKLLNHNKYVAAWSGVYFGSLKIDGQDVPVMGATPKAKVSPPILTGHAFDRSNQVVLGTATLTQLHKKVGDTVTVHSTGAAASVTLRIVGTATMPTIGVGGSSHLEMGSGALLAYQLIPLSQRNLFDVKSGPNAILIRVKAGVNHTAALISFRRILARLGGNSNGGVMQGVQRPAQIINYGTLGSTPDVLGGALAVGAVVALGLTLVASVRRRRRDLALLKTLGFTRRQLASAIAWQSTIAVSLGTVVGVPLGIIVGRFLWGLFAREINAVPSPTVPAVSVLFIVIGGLVLANVVAAIPGRIAARTPTSLMLRAE
jgi:hypothetical protein